MVGFSLKIRLLFTEIALFQDFFIALPESRIAPSAKELGVFWGYRRTHVLVLDTPIDRTSSGAHS